MAKAPSNTQGVETGAHDDQTTSGKGRPTPTRREREAANRRPLVATGKEAQKEQRARLAEQRDRARVGLANGEEKYLPARDKGPQRRYVRDFVDARYSVGEVMIPIMFLVIILTIFRDPTVQAVTLLVLWGFFALAILDSLLVGRQVTKRVTERFGTPEKGLKWYAAMRALQMKPMRLPKPQVKRGQYPE